MERTLDLEELEQRFQSFDWSKMSYDPMDIFNIDHDDDKAVFEKLESIMRDVNLLCNSSRETEIFAIGLCIKYWKGFPMQQQIPQRRIMHADLKVDLKVTEEKLSKIDWNNLKYPGDNRAASNLLQQMQTIASLSPEHAEQMNLLAKKYFKNTCAEKMISGAANELKTKIMNEQNLEYLEKNVKYMGFGESLNEAIRRAAEANSQTFSLHYTANFNESKFDAELHFKRGDQGDRYFFNSYDAKLTNDVATREQTFYLDKGK